MSEQTPPFSRGQRVPQDGTYVCVPCGYKHSYKKGETFSECVSCMAGSSEGDERYAEGLEMWEYMSEEKKEK